MEAAIARFV